MKNKKKIDAGMTKLQIIIIVLLAACVVVIFSTLGVLIFQDNWQSTTIVTKIPTIIATQVMVACDSQEVRLWIDETNIRRAEIDIDFETINTNPPEEFQGYLYYAQRAERRYISQLAQVTPSCLSPIQNLVVEELQLFWKGLDAASKGDRENTIYYLGKLVDNTDNVDFAFQEVVKKYGEAFTPVAVHTKTPNATSTPTPLKIMLSGDINLKWTNSYQSIALIDAYATDIIKSIHPSSPENEFIVVEVIFENTGPVFKDFDYSAFFLTAFADDGNRVAVGRKSVLSEPLEIRLNPSEKVTARIVFEILSSAKNYMLCYGSSGTTSPDGKYLGCPDIASPFRLIK